MTLIRINAQKIYVKQFFANVRIRVLFSELLGNRGSYRTVNE
jgi:hypothetical protein